MPISFGSSESSGNSLFIHSNLPQNRWWVKTEAGDENIDMSRGFAVDIKNVQFGWLHIDIGVRDWQPWPSPSEQIPRPSEQYKQGFEVNCWLVDGREASFSGNSYGLGQFNRQAVQSGRAGVGICDADPDCTSHRQHSGGDRQGHVIRCVVQHLPSGSTARRTAQNTRRPQRHPQWRQRLHRHPPQHPQPITTSAFKQHGRLPRWAAKL